VPLDTSRAGRIGPSVKRAKAKVAGYLPLICPDREAKRQSQSLDLLYLAPRWPCYLHAITEQWDCICPACFMWLLTPSSFVRASEVAKQEKWQ